MNIFASYFAALGCMNILTGHVWQRFTAERYSRFWFGKFSCWLFSQIFVASFLSNAASVEQTMLVILEILLQCMWVLDSFNIPKRLLKNSCRHRRCHRVHSVCFHVNSDNLLYNVVVDEEECTHFFMTCRKVLSKECVTANLQITTSLISALPTTKYRHLNLVIL